MVDWSPSCPSERDLCPTDDANPDTSLIIVVILLENFWPSWPKETWEDDAEAWSALNVTVSVTSLVAPQNAWQKQPKEGRACFSLCFQGCSSLWQEKSDIRCKSGWLYHFIVRKKEMVALIQWLTFLSFVQDYSSWNGVMDALGRSSHLN